RLRVDSQRHPALTGCIWRGKEPLVVQQLVLSIKSDFEPQRQAFLVLPEAGKHLLARAQCWMAPGSHLARFRQRQAKGANLFQSAFIAFGFHYTSVKPKVGSRSNLNSLF